MHGHSAVGAADDLTRLPLLDNKIHRLGYWLYGRGAGGESELHGLGKDLEGRVRL